MLCKTEQLVLLLIGCVSLIARCDWTARLSRNGFHNQVSWRRGFGLILSHTLTHSFTAARVLRMEAIKPLAIISDGGVRGSESRAPVTLSAVLEVSN
ncbi:hypothetical protein F2P79_013931 [Pimephales promelas]|nr:hypothetical protein F2P79_013931 [Pimephales promelas]